MQDCLTTDEITPVTPSPEEEAIPTPSEEETPGDKTDTPEEESQEIDYEALAAEDLAEIKRLDPSYAPAAHLSELPFARRFAELRDLGLSVAEALAAASPHTGYKDGRSHLRAIAPRGRGGTEGTLDRARMKEAKLLFSGLSEGEINALFRRVTQKNYD